MTVKKYHCPHHEEKTPSAVAYANNYYSFCCGRSGPLSELGLAPGERIETVYQEDIASSIESIRSLPKQDIRGFALHADDRGYYLVWGNDSYYKRRIYGAESGSKYRGPSGHSKPWFVARTGVSFPRLALVEGEFNAMSLAAIEPACLDVISPGGAGDFYSRTGKDNLKKCLQYSTIHVIVDSDAAGAQAAIETKSFLVANGHNDVRIHLVEKDFNDIHTQDGLEVLREQAKRMGLCP
jgi:hypothetical protein